MASIEELKRRVDIIDLAGRLGLKQGKGGDNALWHSPTHPDSNPSLSIYIDHPKYGTGFRDHSANVSGSQIDLVIHAQGVDVSGAMKYLHDEYGIPYDRPDKPAVAEPKSALDYIAERSLSNREKVRDYLEGRGITAAAINVAMNAKTIGYNDWVSGKKPQGQVGHGGPAAAFLVRNDAAQLVGVDMRFIDPALNGDVKTQSHGEKFGFGWTADPKRLARAKRVVLVESAINALSVDSCDIPGTAAYAIRGTGNAENIDFAFLRGKYVVICMDNDEPHPQGHPRAGICAGMAAAWTLYERLTALSISSTIVDQSEWLADLADGAKKREPINDVNDYLKLRGPALLAKALDTHEQWLIAGMAGDDTRKGRPRVFLPAHDFAQYWKFRVRPDFTQYIAKRDVDEESGEEKNQYSELCGFRIASLSRISVASANATMTGDPDQSPRDYFVPTVQMPRHGPKLVRKVMTDDQLHNMTHWTKFGPVWQPAQFSRMLTILERTVDLGARSVANFVGLAWRDGKLAVNEGPDCYFTDPEKQCPYHETTFASGTKADARRVITEYQHTFKHNAATMLLVWGLGGHLKALLGFWPHMTLQADKGAGKSTLIKRLERTIGFTMFSGQNLQTEFRLLTSVSHTSHPVGWEELSARRQDVIDKAVALLQENYQYTISRRGAEMTEYLISAPVLLAGEDVPVKSLIGKLVRTNLTGKKGPMMPDDLPRFPVRQWLQFLAGLDRREVLAKYAELRDYCTERSCAAGDDDGAKRMATNYAAPLLAWGYLCEFAGIDRREGGFIADLLGEMNTHIKETSAERSPWVWIMETALSEIDARNFKHPYKFEKHEGHDCLMVNVSHVMDHISTSSSLRDKWNSLPVKTATVLKRQLDRAGVTFDGGKEIERTMNGKRVRRVTPLLVDKLAEFGLSVSWDLNHTREN